MPVKQDTFIDESKSRFVLEVDEKAFEAEKNSADIQGKKAFTRDVAESQKKVAALDRYDDFSKLKIDETAYLCTDKSKGYGIPDSQTGTILYPHQKVAAERFLKERRGFGLLADVVGSGKTFEACAVLSELAVRNKLKSMLLVVPDQVFNSWVKTLEEIFGLGKNVLYQIRLPKKGEEKKIPSIGEVLRTVGVVRDGEFVRPKRPILVDMEIFAQWTFHGMENLLFDAVIVDEAHHLCEDNSEYANAMKLLSQIMTVKKRAQRTYCLLLTATPHSGNLESMFKLWYFIRCQGGNPEFFGKDAEGKITGDTEYEDEKEFYLKSICHGATGVGEFVRKVTLEEVENHYKKYLLDFYHITREEFDGKDDYEKSLIAREFLNKNASINEKVKKEVATKYHSGVLGSIMIRQANNLPKEKRAVNIMFYPTKSKVTKVSSVKIFEKTVTVDFSECQNDENFMPTVSYSGKTESIIDFTDKYRGNKDFAQAYADVLWAIMEKLQQSGGDLGKDGAELFYQQSIKNIPEGDAEKLTKKITMIPVPFTDSKLGHKYEYTKAILNKHKERVLVFFDYEMTKEDIAYREVISALKKEPDLKGRVLVGEKANKDDTISRFNSQADAILIVTDPGFTEGANLQKSSVIINYQVTPDPVAMDQGIGRIFRIGQTSNVTVYSLADMNKLEGYCLAYFACVGLLSSNGGDTTILAGCNSDQMVAVRCKHCGNVKLMSKGAYDSEKKKLAEGRQSMLKCTETKFCRDNDKGFTEMEEISVYDFKCDTCGIVLSRSVVDEGYLCISNGQGKLCNSGKKGDRKMYCRKICALDHCRKYNLGGPLYGKCKALRMYRDNPNTPESVLEGCCEECKEYACSNECKLMMRTDNPSDLIKGCWDCNEWAGCRPHPHILEFGKDEWVADCPTCKAMGRDGKLRPIVARTFATFIRGCWNFKHDKGKMFCRNLENEMLNVNNICNILRMDDSLNKRK